MVGVAGDAHHHKAEIATVRVARVFEGVRFPELLLALQHHLEAKERKKSRRLVRDGAGDELPEDRLPFVLDVGVRANVNIAAQDQQLTAWDRLLPSAQEPDHLDLFLDVRSVAPGVTQVVNNVGPLVGPVVPQVGQRDGRNDDQRPRRGQVARSIELSLDGTPLADAEIRLLGPKFKRTRPALVNEKNANLAEDMGVLLGAISR